MLAAAVSLLGAGGAAADDVQRILVIGDSQAQGLAGGLQRLYRRDRQRRVLDRSRISTGLTSRSAYDWPQAVRGLAETEHSEVAVALFGANDRPVVRVGGQIDPRLSQRFRDSYGARVGDIVQTLRHAGSAVIWVGHPIVRDPQYAEDIALLNSIFEDAATAAGAQFLSLWEVFKSPEGGYAAYGPGVDGEPTRLRADDGVHLTPAGYDVVAQLLAPRLNALRSTETPATHS